MARICVFCSSSERIDPSYQRLAQLLGSEIAGRGHDLVSGGGRVSMMGAVARAVRAGGGHTLGVIPEALVPLEVADTDADELVVTRDMRQRKGLMDDAADAFIAVAGGLGTLEELLEIWVARTLDMHAKPIVVLDPTGLYEHLRHLVDTLTASGFVRPEAAGAITWVRESAAALDVIESSLQAGSQRGIRRDPAPATAQDHVEELLEAEQ
jgi:uncharacterized protein (TIGR00730 family)